MIEHDLDFTSYVGKPGINQSLLRHIVCPKRFKWYMSNKQAETEALLAGQAVHTAALEPEKFNAQFLCLPELDRRTTKGKEAYAEIIANNPDKKILKPDVFNMAIDVALAIRTEPHCAALLKKTEKEVTVDWVDQETQTLCKARIDAWDKKRGIVIDIKTTQDASPKGFARKLFA